SRTAGGWVSMTLAGEAEIGVAVAINIFPLRGAGHYGLCEAHRGYIERSAGGIQERIQKSEVRRRSIRDEFMPEAVVQWDGGQEVGDFLGRSAGAVDVFPGEANGMAVVPDLFECAVDAGGVGGD